MQLVKKSQVQVLFVGVFAAGALFTTLAVAEDAHAVTRGAAHSVAADLNVGAAVNGTDGVDPWS